jgi:alpha-1,3-glucosyltransferase
MGKIKVMTPEIENCCQTSITMLMILLALLLRVLIAPFPYSGKGNHHGLTNAYGGDYEAQRHWMELTIHRPLSEWYTYSEDYWRLDYPPLIAYWSYLMGIISSKLVGEESVALFDSRGYESEVHQSFMRATVILSDILVYFPLTFMLCRRLAGNCHRGMILWFGVLIQPSLVSIDNGHFQYNSVCLGLSLGAFHFMTLSDSVGYEDVVGSILFCMALNWKQMTLYYAPAVFSYLLGKCFRENTTTQIIRKIALLGVTVLGTFFVLWFPFYHYRTIPEQSAIEVYSPIIRRIFPFSRGLFEGKVSNIWCILALKPFSIRDRISLESQPLYALLLTVCMTIPFCVQLFRVANNKRNLLTGKAKAKCLLLGAAGTSLSFFLASFQVHEKSILLPLAPLSFLTLDYVSFIPWFSMISLWSMWHLLCLDQLQIVYLVLLWFYGCYLVYFDLITVTVESTEQQPCFLEIICRQVFRMMKPITIFTMCTLHVLEVLVDPPLSLPDIYPVLWIILACCSFCFAWLFVLGILRSCSSLPTKLD